MTEKRMVFSEDLSTSSDYLRMAVPLMIQRQIPPTPHNYALWYAHVQNAHPELSATLLEQFPGPGSYDPDVSESLFFDFFIKTYLPNSPQAQNLLVSILTQLARSVAQSAEGSKAYGESLKETIHVLEEPIDSERIRAALSQLLEDTVSMEGLNNAFRSELQAVSAEVAKLKKELEQSQYNARVDSLTKIANRRAFNDALQQALGSDEEPASLLLLDLDRFKQCNDTYGHLMGDRILEIVGGVLAELQSDSVFVARYGGEEFAVIATSPLGPATELAERIRRKVAGIRIQRKGSKDFMGEVTVSIGVVQARGGESPDSLIERADAALYRAKDGGRDQVVALNDSHGTSVP
ncbi:GGDEF domain-containing protein [Thiorhodococcus mannitoliphagus]|uniref:diguanylate cyclase n=1 Tax=Thiorhodococcus mannitoliphagus TaxID=329406 RepID=A0A6P1DU10_9GAMM|nr:GGDEF domain-containing protein [Thiorhodococcus mannitoliphagus]NEX19184.1 GGDEF domain-containing protein [Thiorhodococcus mannitoliphagus]